MSIEKIAGLNVKTNRNKKSNVAFLLMHGFGADANDLYPLSEHLKVDQSMDWFLPNGIINVPLSPTMQGRAWFPIDMAEMEAAMSRGEFRDFKGKRPKGIDAALEKVQDLYEILEDQYEKIIVGGFSQGAMLAIDLCASVEIKPDALVVLSGTLLNEQRWRELLPSCKGLKFFQSHGTWDPVLPFAGAEELLSVLKKSGLVGDLLPFMGQHEIPVDTLEALKNFLNGVV